jgi:hypothetical protein
MLEAVSSRQSFGGILPHDPKICIGHLLKRIAFVADMFKEHIF